MSVAKVPNDGVINSSGFALAGVAPTLFLAGIPLSSFLTQPGGIVEKGLNGLVSTVAYVGTAGASSTVSAGRMVPAMSAFYLFAVYAFGGSISAASTAIGSPKGRNNDSPRAQIANLTGLPLRMHAAASHLQETFPAWALAAALSLILAPTNQQIINLLGLAMMSKMFVFLPAYIANVSVPRSLAHLLATSSVVNVAWKLARGAI